MNLKRPVDLKGLLQLTFAGLMMIALSVLLGPVLNRNSYLSARFLNPGFALYAAGFAVFFFSLLITAFFLFGRLMSFFWKKLKTRRERKIQSILMQKFIFILLLLAGFSLFSLQGEEKNSKSSSWEVGIGAYNISYRDADGGAEAGFLTGGQVSYTSRKNASFWKVAASYYGGMPYTNTINYDNQRITAINDDGMQELRILLGGQISSHSYLSAGLGVLDWFKSPKAGLVFVERRTYLYTPIIWEAARGEGKNRRFWRIEGDWLWNGRVKSTPAWFPAGYNQPVNRLSSGYGLRVSYDLIKSCGRKRDFVLQPNVEYWNIAKSDTQALTCNGIKMKDYFIPQNTTLFYGLNFNWEF